MSLKRLITIIFIINAGLFLWGNVVLADSCPTDNGQGTGCTGNTPYYCSGACRTATSVPQCPTYTLGTDHCSPVDPGCGPGCAASTGWGSCGICTQCLSTHLLCSATSGPDRKCAEKGLKVDSHCSSCTWSGGDNFTCTSCAAGYTIFGNQCVRTVLKLGPDSVSGNSVIQGNDASSTVFISGDSVTIGTSTGADIYIVGASTLGNLRMINNKSIKVDSNSTNTTLLIGNYGDGQGFGYGASTTYTASLAVEGDVKANQLCIKESCRGTWADIEGINYWTASGDNIYNNNTGNVGIGDTGPTNKLSVNGDIAGSGTLKISNSSGLSYVMGNLSVGGSGGFSGITLSRYLDIVGDDYAGAVLRTTDVSSIMISAQNGTPAGANFGYAGKQMVVGTINNSPINFIASGTSKMLMTSSGKVGIGTTNPQTSLDVIGGSRFYASGGGRYFWISPSSDNQEIGTSGGQLNLVPASGSILIYREGLDTTLTMHDSNGSDTVRLNSHGSSFFVGGNVGIGTQEPVAKLQIDPFWFSNPDETDTINLAESDFANVSVAPQAMITMNNRDRSPGAAIGLALHNADRHPGAYAPLLVFSKSEISGQGKGFNSAIAAIGAQTVEGTGGHGMWVDGDLMFYTAPKNGGGLVERMRITQGGNVGINTQNPLAKLDVNGSLAVRGAVAFTNSLYTGTSSRLLMVDASGNVSATSTLAGISMPSGTTGQTLRYGTSAWEATSTIYITDGKVGVGTTNPRSKLEVNGNIYVSPAVSYAGSDIFGVQKEQRSIVTVPAAGWYKVAHIDSSNGRGQNTVTIHTTGGSYTPVSVTMRWFHDWGTSAGISVISEMGNTSYWSQARVTDDGVNSFLEVYFTQAISNLYLSLQYDGGFSAGSLYSGDLVAGGGDVRASTPLGLFALSDKFVVNSSGNVGIGTTSPSASLAVNGNAIANAPTASGHLATKGYVDSSIQNLWVNSGSNLYASSTGWNVGIGTTTPVAQLDVNGSLAVRGAVSFTGPSYTGSNRLLMVDSAGNVSATSTLSGISMPSGTTGQTLRYGASGWEATSTIHITNDGKVGIGTTNPGAKLEVYSGDLKINGGKLYLADTAGQNATYLQSYSGGSNLWMIQPGATQSFIIADAISWDRSLSFNYTPGATGAGTGRLTIGQTSKNGTTFTHGITSLYTNGLERMRIDVNGNVGIGTTNPTVALHVNGNAIANTPTANGHLATKGYVDSAMQSLWVNSGNYLYASSTGWNVGIGTTTPGAKLDVNGNLAVRGAVSFTDATLYAGSGSRYLMIDNSGGVFATTTAGGGGDYVLKGGDIMSGTLHFETSTGVAIDANQNNIIGVNKLSVVIIDPLYDIGGVKYSSYAPSIVGGIKEEYVGRGNIKNCGSEFCSWILDFSQVSKGSDLWVWRQIIDFRPETIEVIMTAYGQPALLSYEIGDNQIKFHSDRPTQFSYRLVGSRFDWRRWPTLAPDQSESTSLIIK